ncbi:hypothetical protein BKA65DRAFT_561986 [Rhexocercosporidium sp. MPI-PUGE-AT-0058]|nr:hypothetical protein BKA65DRAFT_561986 [Rhexocercosporidium sp. MPI-PUGE-AT-0058]
MSQKRRALSEDGELITFSPERSRKHIKVETHEQTPRRHITSFATVILSGFTWNMNVDARISRALDPYNPVFMEVSLELPSAEKLGIMYKYGIQTDFVTVACESFESRDRIVLDLDHARFSWTEPFLKARVIGVEVEDEGSGNKTNTQKCVHPHRPDSATTIHPEQNRRAAQAKVWIKLSESITNARAHLFGDDLDTFEALIAKPMPGVDPMERINRWIRRGLPEVQPQRMNIAPRVKIERVLDASANRENVSMDIPRVKVEKVLDGGADKEDISMDDEMANMGITFGLTNLTPWW